MFSCPEALVAGKAGEMFQRNHGGGVQGNGSAGPRPSSEARGLSRLLLSVGGKSSETEQMFLRKHLQDGAEGWLSAEQRLLNEQAATHHWGEEVGMLGNAEG